MHFLIFIPNATSLADLAKAGLVDLCGDAHVTPGFGPGGRGGAMFSWAVNGRFETLYREATQDWFPAAPFGEMPAERYFVGFSKAHPCLPSDLLRPYHFDGTDVALGDGYMWHVPEAAKLPRDLHLADNGTWKFVPQRRFHEYSLLAQRWRQKMLAYSPGDAIDAGELADFAIWTLGINYRITREVASHLRLFTDAGKVGTLRVTMNAITGLKDSDDGES